MGSGPLGADFDEGAFDEGAFDEGAFDEGGLKEGEVEQGGFEGFSKEEMGAFGDDSDKPMEMEMEEKAAGRDFNPSER